jgi:hypothetical protein
VLARLDEIDGVTESRVDWTGTRFLIGLAEGAEEPRVSTKAAETLGGGARMLGERETRDALASYHEGEAWMRAGETLRLSRYEARVLARRYASEAALDIGLDGLAEDRLEELFESELYRAFERTHAGSDVEALPLEIGGAIRRILDASAAFLEPEERAALATYLERFAADRP